MKKKQCTLILRLECEVKEALAEKAFQQKCKLSSYVREILEKNCKKVNK